MHKLHLNWWSTCCCCCCCCCCCWCCRCCCCCVAREEVKNSKEAKAKGKRGWGWGWGWRKKGPRSRRRRVSINHRWHVHRYKRLTFEVAVDTNDLQFWVKLSTRWPWWRLFVLLNLIRGGDFGKEEENERGTTECYNRWRGCGWGWNQL